VPAGDATDPKTSALLPNTTRDYVVLRIASDDGLLGYAMGYTRGDTHGSRLKGLSTLGFDLIRFQTKPPVCYGAS
jgi:hypothetical protein